MRAAPAGRAAVRSRAQGRRIDRVDVRDKSVAPMNRCASPRLAYLGQLSALAVGYVALGRLGLAISPVGGFATLVWAPAGLSFAALVLGGHRLWPAVAAGALVTNLGVGAPPLVACGIAAGNTIEAVAGALAMRAALDSHRPFDREADVFALAVPAALVSTAVGAALGTASLALGGMIARTGFARVWGVWWVGDLVSDLVLAPLLLTWARPVAAPPRARAESVLLGALLMACAALAFAQPPDALARLHVVGAAVLLPPLLWAAVRFGPRGAATATFVASVVAVWGTVTGHGSFARADVPDGLLNLHVSLAMTALGMLALGSIVAERDRSLEALRASEARLRAVMDGTTDVIFIKDRLGRYLLMNATGARLLRSLPEAIVGQDDAALFPLDQAQRLRALDEDVMRAGQPRTAALSLTLAGTNRVFEGTVVPYRDAAGAVLGVIGITRDVTEQRSAERTRDRLAAIVESSADAILAVALDGTILGWNAAAERLFGYTREEAIGQPFAMLIPREQADEHARLLDQIRRGEPVVNHEVVRRRKDGNRIEIAVTRSPLYDAAGTLVGCSSIVRDVTESVERWRLASEAAQLGMWWWSIKGDRIAWTPRCRESHGIGPEEESSYSRFVAALHPDDREMVERAIQRAIEGQAGYRVVYRVVWPDGSLHWISVLGRVFCDRTGEAVRMLGVAQDITAQKQAEVERAELLTREQAARAAAESAGRAKDEFLAVVSHELRTPLQSMLGWAQMLKARPDEPATVRKGLDIIERNARTQAQLIEDLLDVSRIVAGTLRMERRRVDLAEVLASALDAIRVLADARSIRIDRVIEPVVGSVLGDAQRLHQVLSNLLSNAVKFTPPQGRIGVRLDRRGTTARIAIDDSGCGIDPEFLPYVFERFRQEEEGATTRRSGGLGLGLAIVSHLVEAHGGTVKAESPGRGRGATFTVTLPLVSMAGRALTDEGAETAAYHDRRTRG